MAHHDATIGTGRDTVPAASIAITILDRFRPCPFRAPMTQVRVKGDFCMRILSSVVPIAVILAAAASAGPGAAAATFEVNTTLDTLDISPGDGVCADGQGNCSLRAAIMEANVWAGADLIVLKQMAGDPHFVLTIAGRGEDRAATGDLDIYDNLQIRPEGLAPNPRIIDAGYLDRVFHILGGAHVTLRGLWIVKGNVMPTMEEGGGIFNESGQLVLERTLVSFCYAGNWGGGIASEPGSYLELYQSNVSQNHAVGSGGGVSNRGGYATITESVVTYNGTTLAGGGIANIGSGAVMIVSASGIRGNKVTDSDDVDQGGGGIHNLQGQLVVVNSSLFSNTSNGVGAGVMNAYGIASLSNVTITDNTAATAGGGLYTWSSTTTMERSILTTNNPTQCAHGAGSSNVSLGHNIANDTSCDLVGGGDMPNTYANLGGLQGNGTTTLYRVPGSNSPAIDGGGVSGCPAKDQRQVSRPSGAACDIGAVEYAPMVALGELHPQSQGFATVTGLSSEATAVEWRNGGPASVSLRLDAPGSTPEERAYDFLRDNVNLYLVNDPNTDLVHSRTDDDPGGGSLVRFGQRYHDLPVFGAEIVVHLDIDPAGGQTQIVHTSGMLMPTIRTDTAYVEPIDPILTPSLLPEEAQAVAAGALGRPPTAVQGQTLLVIFDPRIFEQSGDPRLAYRVTVGGGDPVQILVDAIDGTILFRNPLSWDHNPVDYDMQLVDAGMAPWCPPSTPVIADEGGVNYGWVNNPDTLTLWNASSTTYQWYHSALGRHSYDDDDGDIEVFMNVAFNPPNAKANVGCGIEFSPGYASLDVFAHEFTHLVTEEESGLIYQGWPGALNEAYSDIMGVSVDSLDWTIGEDRTNGAGAIRDVSNPPALNCSLSDQNPSTFPCPDHYSLRKSTTDDNGGVHTNSNIINKAFYLMATGGTFHAIPVIGFGRAKMQQIAYQTFNALSPNDDAFALRGDALSWADIYAYHGWYGFTAQDVCTIRNAFAAVGIGAQDGDCDGQEDNLVDPDLDGVLSPANLSPGSVPPNPCQYGQTQGCDDNCPWIPNANQANLDNDYHGDVCDADVDNDGNLDLTGPCAPAPSTDFDMDGILDCFDDDIDGDGVPEDGDGLESEGGRALRAGAVGRVRRQLPVPGERKPGGRRPERQGGRLRPGRGRRRLVSG